MSKPAAETKPAAPARPEDDSLDRTLRPTRFEEFVGQTKTVENLKVYIAAAKNRKESVDHVLFSGPPGLGKTTLASLVAEGMGARFRSTTGPTLERAADLAGLLTNLQSGDVLFIDEIHRIPPGVEEYLYSAMEDYAIHIMIDPGPHARSLKLSLPRFTLIGATTREGLLSEPFRARFGVLEKLTFYPDKDLVAILKRSAKILEVALDAEAGQSLAARARGTPRIANRLLRRVRDLAQVKSDGKITQPIADEGLKMQGIDGLGLDEMDRKILKMLVEARGSAVGLKTLAAAVDEAEDTIEEVYEPFLLQQNLLQKTARGRCATEKAFRHLGASVPEDLQGKLFS